MHRIYVTGNVGKDPVIKAFENGGKVANFSVADTEKGYKTKDGKEIPPHTEWFNCVVRQNGLCGVVEQYVKKGTFVEVLGKIRTREYEKDGQKLSVKELIVEEFNMPPKGDGGNKPTQAEPAPKDDDLLPW
jgi:single-strand DNA-binding protein